MSDGARSRHFRGLSSATVRRVLPNQIGVEITERTPIAFLREPGDLALIDAHGMILTRPVRGNFHFPVVTGIMPGMPLDSREERMQLFSGFTQQIESVRPDAIDQISEVDLSDAHDLRATLTGFAVYRREQLYGGSAGAPARRYARAGAFW